MPHKRPLGKKLPGIPSGKQDGVHTDEKASRSPERTTIPRKDTEQSSATSVKDDANQNVVDDVEFQNQSLGIPMSNQMDHTESLRGGQTLLVGSLTFASSEPILDFNNSVYSRRGSQAISFHQESLTVVRLGQLYACETMGKLELFLPPISGPDGSTQKIKFRKQERTPSTRQPKAPLVETAGHHHVPDGVCIGPEPIDESAPRTAARQAVQWFESVSKVADGKIVTAIDIYDKSNDLHEERISEVIPTHVKSSVASRSYPSMLKCLKLVESSDVQGQKLVDETDAVEQLSCLHDDTDVLIGNPLQNYLVTDSIALWNRLVSGNKKRKSSTPQLATTPHSADHHSLSAFGLVTRVYALAPMLLSLFPRSDAITATIQLYQCDTGKPLAEPFTWEHLVDGGDEAVPFVSGSYTPLTPEIMSSAYNLCIVVQLFRMPGLDSVKMAQAYTDPTATKMTIKEIERRYADQMQRLNTFEGERAGHASICEMFAFGIIPFNAMDGFGQHPLKLTTERFVLSPSKPTSELIKEFASSDVRWDSRNVQIGKSIKLKIIPCFVEFEVQCLDFRHPNAPVISTPRALIGAKNSTPVEFESRVQLNFSEEKVERLMYCSPYHLPLLRPVFSFMNFVFVTLHSIHLKPIFEAETTTNHFIVGVSLCSYARHSEPKRLASIVNPPRVLRSDEEYQLPGNCPPFLQRVGFSSVFAIDSSCEWLAIDERFKLLLPIEFENRTLFIEVTLYELGRDTLTPVARSALSVGASLLRKRKNLKSHLMMNALWHSPKVRIPGAFASDGSAIISEKNPRITWVARAFSSLFDVSLDLLSNTHSSDPVLTKALLTLPDVRGAAIVTKNAGNISDSHHRDDNLTVEEEIHSFCSIITALPLSQQTRLHAPVLLQTVLLLTCIPGCISKSSRTAALDALLSLAQRLHIDEFLNAEQHEGDLLGAVHAHIDPIDELETQFFSSTKLVSIPRIFLWYALDEHIIRFAPSPSEFIHLEMAKKLIHVLLDRLKWLRPSSPERTISPSSVLSVSKVLSSGMWFLLEAVWRLLYLQANKNPLTPEQSSELTSSVKVLLNRSRQLIDQPCTPSTTQLLGVLIRFVGRISVIVAPTELWILFQNILSLINSSFKNDPTRRHAAIRVLLNLSCETKDSLGEFALQRWFDDLSLWATGDHLALTDSSSSEIHLVLNMLIPDSFSKNADTRYSALYTICRILSVFQEAFRGDHNTVRGLAWCLLPWFIAHISEVGKDSEDESSVECNLLESRLSLWILQNLPNHVLKSWISGVDIASLKQFQGLILLLTQLPDALILPQESHEKLDNLSVTFHLQYITTVTRVLGFILEFHGASVFRLHLTTLTRADHDASGLSSGKEQRAVITSKFLELVSVFALNLHPRVYPVLSFGPSAETAVVQILHKTILTLLPELLASEPSRLASLVAILLFITAGSPHSNIQSLAGKACVEVSSYLEATLSGVVLTSDLPDVLEGMLLSFWAKVLSLLSELCIQKTSLQITETLADVIDVTDIADIPKLSEPSQLSNRFALTLGELASGIGGAKPLQQTEQPSILPSLLHLLHPVFNANKLSTFAKQLNTPILFYYHQCRAMEVFLQHGLVGDAIAILLNHAKNGWLYSRFPSIAANASLCAVAIVVTFLNELLKAPPTLQDSPQVRSPTSFPPHKWLKITTLTNGPIFKELLAKHCPGLKQDSLVYTAIKSAASSMALLNVVDLTLMWPEESRELFTISSLVRILTTASQLYAQESIFEEAIQINEAICEIREAQVIPSAVLLNQGINKGLQGKLRMAPPLGVRASSSWIFVAIAGIHKLGSTFVDSKRVYRVHPYAMSDLLEFARNLVECEYGIHAPLRLAETCKPSPSFEYHTQLPIIESLSEFLEHCKIPSVFVAPVQLETTDDIGALISQNEFFLYGKTQTGLSTLREDYRQVLRLSVKSTSCVSSSFCSASPVLEIESITEERQDGYDIVLTTIREHARSATATVMELSSLEPNSTRHRRKLEEALVKVTAIFEEGTPKKPGAYHMAVVAAFGSDTSHADLLALLEQLLDSCEAILTLYPDTTADAHAQLSRILVTLRCLMLATNQC